MKTGPKDWQVLLVVGAAMLLRAGLSWLCQLFLPRAAADGLSYFAVFMGCYFLFRSRTTIGVVRWVIYSALIGILALAIEHFLVNPI